jgi:hypothetical protein
MISIGLESALYTFTVSLLSEERPLIKNILDVPAPLTSYGINGSTKAVNTITLLGKSIEMHFLNKLNLLRSTEVLLIILKNYLHKNCFKARYLL